MIVEVIVDVKHRAVDQVFDYLVPQSMSSLIAVGQRVIVPFTSRKITGFVHRIKDASPVTNLKSIIGIKDITPLLSKELLSLSETLSKNYAQTRLSVIETMLPSALKMTYETQLVCHDLKALPEAIKPYFSHRNVVSIKALEPQLKLIKPLIEQGILETNIVFKQRANIVKDIYVYLKNEGPVKGQKQLAVIAALKTAKQPIIKSQLMTETQAASQTLKRLETLGIIGFTSLEKYREIESLYACDEQPVTLNDAQALIVETIHKQRNHYQPFLLHGVASSGKTEIYLALAEKVLKNNQSVIVLLPEISLTPKITARFKSRFKDQVVTYHSQLSLGEQYDQWRKALKSEAHIVIGARSAIFAPLDNVGLIIIDEAHSESYIQQDHPRYHAIDVAKFRAQHHHIPVLLGTATPSIESYYHATQGQYQLLELKTRALNSQTPNIHLVDMKEAFKEGNRSIFSESLQKAIKARLKAREQIVLLINRRGHANFLLCRACGHVVNCPECDISLTYHHHNQTLHCHHCHHREPVVKICPNCKSPHIRYMGIGSEQVELEVKKMFPSASVMRMDKDTTSAKNAHEHILHTFEHTGDILIGTQMISKGLDFDRVTLVGVLSADMSLQMPSYNAASETYQLLTQIAGRAGRRQIQGDVYIQAYQVDHPILNAVLHQDFQAYYAREIDIRQRARIRPFYSVTELMVSHTELNSAFKEALKIVNKLNKVMPKETIIIGPTKPFRHKRNQRYLYQIIIKSNHHIDYPKVLSELMTTLKDTKTELSVNHHPTMF